MKKAAAYPVTVSVLPVIRYWNSEWEEPKIAAAVMPQKKYLLGKDIATLCNHESTGIIIYDDLFQALTDCDTVVVMPDLGAEEDILEDLKKAAILGKNILCMRKLAEEEVVILRKLSADANMKFEYRIQPVKEADFCYIPKTLYHPRIPVVMVGEIYNGLDGIDIVLTIHNLMKSAGYRSLAVTELELELPGFIPYPDFLRNSEYKMDEKVYYLNNMIKYIDLEQKPDVLVVQVPDAMMKYSDSICNGFGILPFCISQAVTPDYFILCIEYAEMEKGVVERLRNGIRGRYGFEIDSIHMSNAFLDVEDTVLKGEISVLRQSQEVVNRLIKDRFKEYSVPIWNCLEKRDSRRLAEHIIECLTGYGTECCGS